MSKEAVTAEKKQGAVTQVSCPVNMNGAGKVSPSAPPAFISFCNWTRTILSVVLSLVLVALVVWTVLEISNKMVALQDRVSALETQCQLNKQNIQKYIGDKLDKVLEEVRFLIDTNI